MSSFVPAKSVLFAPGEAKTSVNTRITAGGKIASVAVSSPLYTGQQEIHAGVDTVVADTTSLKTFLDDYNTARAKFKKARTALGTAVATWDASFDMLIAAGEKFCTSVDDATKLALPTRNKTKNPLAMPISIDGEYRAQIDVLHVHVHRAPGMNVVSAEWTTNPNDPSSWKEFDGCGAIHTLKHPVAGTYWVRACSKTAKGKSDFTTPICILVP